MSFRAICLIALSSLLSLGGCASVKLDDANRILLQNAIVSPKAKMPADMTYQSVSQSIGEGLGGPLGAAIAESGKSDKVLMQEHMASNHIEVGEILATEFAKALMKSGKVLETEKATTPSSTFSFEFMMYGLQKTQGFSSKLYPVFVVTATLKSNDGKVLWRRNEYVTALHPDNTLGAEPGVYLSNPELLRQSFTNAAAILSRELIENL